MFLLLLVLTLAHPAHALTSRQSGPYGEVAAGLGLGDRPLHAGLGWEVGAGWWRGRYDDAYAIGRYWSGGVTLRQDWITGALRTSPLIELRRGTDLIVAGWWAFLAGGPLVATAEDTGAATVGGTARTGIGAEFRRTRYLGITLRLEGGVDYVGRRIGGTGAALLGFQFSRPKAGSR